MTTVVKSIFQELDEIDEAFSKDLKYLSNEEFKGLKTILFSKSDTQIKVIVCLANNQSSEKQLHLL